MRVKCEPSLRRVLIGPRTGGVVDPANRIAGQARAPFRSKKLKAPMERFVKIGQPKPSHSQETIKDLVNPILKTQEV